MAVLKNATNASEAQKIIKNYETAKSAGKATPITSTQYQSAKGYVTAVAPYQASKATTPAPTAVVGGSAPSSSFVPAGTPIPTSNPSVTGNFYGDAKNQEYNKANNTGITPTYVDGTSNKLPNNVVPSGIVPVKAEQPVNNGASSSPYTKQIADALAAYIGMMNNKKEFNPDTDAGLKVAQKSAMAEADRNAARRGMLFANSSKYGEQSALQAGQRLIPQYQQMFNQNEQQKANDLFNMLSVLQGMDNTSYNRGRDIVTDNRYVDTQTYNRGRDTLADTRYNTEKEKQDYVNSITGLGEQFDYQAEINKITSDSDTSNDWKIPYLKQEREKKTQTKLQTELTTIGQYANNYQAEIDRRGDNDPLTPYLKVARAQKIATQNAETLSRQDQLIKSAYDRWKAIGVADQTVSSVLGIPVGSKTADYQKAMADISQSNASASASIMNAQTNANELAYKKEQDANTSGEMQYSTNYPKSIERINTLYDTLSESGKVMKSVYNPQTNAWEKTTEVEKDWMDTPGSVSQLKLIQAIMSEPISNYEKQQLFKRYGLSYNTQG